jgi:hypothetical protein
MRHFTATFRYYEGSKAHFTAIRLNGGSLVKNDIIIDKALGGLKLGDTVAFSANLSFEDVEILSIIKKVKL